MIESTERDMVDIVMNALMGIADIGLQIGSLYVTLVNVVVAAVTDEVHRSSALSCKFVQRDDLRFKQETKIGCDLIRE